MENERVNEPGCEILNNPGIPVLGSRFGWFGIKEEEEEKNEVLFIIDSLEEKP